jgi:hypothetical protein
LWSKGEKDDPAGRATPLLAAEADIPGIGSQLPLGERGIGGLDPLARLAALGAGRRLGGPGVRVGGGVLLQQPGGQILAEIDGALLALVKGDESALRVVGEHAVEGGGGVLEPLSAQTLARDGGGRVVVEHSGSLQVR